MDDFDIDLENAVVTLADGTKVPITNRYSEIGEELDCDNCTEEVRHIVVGPMPDGSWDVHELGWAEVH